MKAKILRELVQSGKRPIVKLSDFLWDESWGEKGMIAEVTNVAIHDPGDEPTFIFTFDYNRFRDVNLPLQSHGWCLKGRNETGTAFQAGIMKEDDITETFICLDVDEINADLSESGLISEYVVSNSPLTYVQWLEAKLEDALNHRYTPTEVVQWLFAYDAYDGKYRELALTEWVKNFRESMKTDFLGDGK